MLYDFWHLRENPAKPHFSMVNHIFATFESLPISILYFTYVFSMNIYYKFIYVLIIGLYTIGTILRLQTITAIFPYSFMRMVSGDQNNFQHILNDDVN